MSNYTQIRDILKRMSGQDNVITIPRVYVDFTEDLTTAALLNQIVFYSDKSKRTDGFFYKTYDDWEKETGLSKRQVSYSTKKLKELGLVETAIKKADGAPTVHYKLYYDKLLDSIVTKCHYGKEQNVTMDSNKMSLSLTENTTENTTENKDNVGKPTDLLFEEWWDVYGKKVGDKKRCRTKYKSLLKKNAHELMVEGTKRYKRYLQALKDNGEFSPAMKNPLTFLNGENFNDEYEFTSKKAPAHEKPTFRPDSVDLGDEVF